MGLRPKSNRMRGPAVSSVPIRCGAVLAAMLAIGVSLLLLIPAGSGAGAPEARGLGEETVVLAVWATIEPTTSGL